jgi:hypothetical protein
MLSPKILTNQNCSRGFIINVCLRKEAALGRLPKDTGRIYCGSCSEFKVATAKVTSGAAPSSTFNENVYVAERNKFPEWICLHHRKSYIRNIPLGKFYAL